MIVDRFSVLPSGRQIRTEEDEMNKITLLAMILVTMLVSLGGCFLGYPEHDRDGGHDRHERGERQYDRDGGYDRR